MIIVNAKDLDKHGISYQSSAQLVFRGRVFRKGQAFAAHLKDLAIECAEENLAVGKPCIVVDCESHITLWHMLRSPIGVKTHPTPRQKNKSQGKSSTQAPAIASKKMVSQEMASKKMGQSARKQFHRSLLA